jgi:UDP-N-acetylmuramoyl-L-alanyl-D-glutamate--2,6-diaminopimelate ligase
LRLSALLDSGARVAGDPEVEVTGLSADTRTLEPGQLFAALPGSRADGAGFVDEAIAKGAAAILAGPALAGRTLPVPLVVDPDPRRRLALMAARWFGAQPRVLAAVTGTNGKTSVAGFTRQLWARAGRRAASLGTLGVQAPGLDRPGSLTTPDPVALHRLLAELAEDGIDHLVLEASSHGIDQRRLDGVRLKGAALTNITQDHFDYHGSYEAYAESKWRLFGELLPPGATAVLNADIPDFPERSRALASRGLVVLDYGRMAHRLRFTDHAADDAGQRFTLAADGREHPIAVPLMGVFQVYNLLAALGLGLATGLALEDMLASFAGLEGARGRLEKVAVHPSGAPVFVDYAHTPDALEQVLRALRPHARRRLVLVFGCGGDRDAGKRPLMGGIAAELAERVIVTDDNPRTEDPALIRRAILAECPGAVEIGDRAEAIADAVRGLRAGDLLVIAGKGHETGQITGDRVLPFDDALVARRAVAALTGAAA